MEIPFRHFAWPRGLGLNLIMLTPADIHDNPTIQDLATLIESRTTVASAWTVPGAVSPLSPMQRYYFSWAKPNPNKFNVGFISRLAEPLHQKLLQGALNAVVAHHDALRLRFTKSDDGSYGQHYIDLPDAQRIPVHNIALPPSLPETQILFIRREIERQHDTLDIRSGPVMTVALFTDPHGTNHHLFLTMHELVTDALSLQITLEDLRTAYDALEAGKPAVLPPQTTPYHQWVEKVISYAQGPQAVEQLDYWISDASDALPFPEDSTAEGALQSDIENHGFEVLDASQMASIRERLGGAAQSTLIHAIVGSLAVTANHLSGQRNLIFHKVAHGREACIRDADPSRTVGWFITHTPITARLPAGAIDDQRALAATLEAVSAQYRAIPHNGIGHSALRYYSSDPRAAILGREDKVRTLFQYIGNVWEDNYDGVMFLPTHPSLMDVPDTVAAENLADYHLHVYAYVMDGCFRMKLFYTRPNYRTETIVKMADILTWAIKGMLVPEWTAN